MKLGSLFTIFVSFKKPPKIRGYLARSKLYPLERVVGSIKCCKNRCEKCINVSTWNTFTINVTGKTYTINYKLGCDDNC